MKGKKHLTILIILFVFSYFMMVNKSMAAGSKDIQAYYQPAQETRIKTNFNKFRDLPIREIKLIQYIEELTGLDYSYCEFLIEESNKKSIDPFLVLGVIKRESDFNPKAIGAAGELGLGQLMENTARVIAENLGYTYNHEMLLDPEFNLKLTITQLSYLNNLYDMDMHKALTAYNRGQQGLENYINSYDKKGVSDYSTKALSFARDYRMEFEKYENLQVINY